MGRLARLLASVGIAALASACTPDAPPPPAVEAPADRVVFVVSNGWHANVVVARDEVADLPEAAHFPEAAFLEFGWGDRKYYPEPDPGVMMALRAALAPTSAVVHVVGLDLPPAATYPEQEVLEVPVSGPGVARLAEELHKAFARQQAGAATPLGPGLQPESHFYPATGQFHLFNTCNTWAARLLAAAGVDISPSGIVTSGQLMGRLANLVTVTRLTEG